MAELASMYVSIIPSFKGGAAAIEKQMGGSVKSAGVSAGREFGKAFSAQEISAQNVKKFTSEVATASAKLATVRQKEEDAAGAVRVAEAKLAEVRAKALPGSSQLIAAEERAAVASRRLATAQAAAAGPAEALARAQAQLETATEEAGRAAAPAAATYAKGWAGLKAKMKDVISGPVREGVDDADQEAEQGGKKAGGSFATAFKGGLATLATAAGIGGIGATFMGALTADADNDKLAASLGLSPADSARAGKIAGTLYAGAWGASMADASSAVGTVMSSISGMRTASSEDITAITAKALDLASAFELDIPEAAGVAGQLIKDGLAVDATQAFDLIADAMQGVPVAMRGEIFPIMSEYGKHFKTLGIDGTTAFGIVKMAAQDGAIGMDKIGDALKEFSLKAVNMDKPAVAAFEFMGLSAEKMATGMAKGGAAGQEAFAETIKGLQGIKDPANQAQAAIALFGTPLEDLGTDNIPAFLGQLDPMGDSFDSVAGAADRLGVTLNGNTATDIEMFKRGIEVGITETLNEKVIPAILDAAKWIQESFIPALEGAVKWIKENAAWLVPLTAGVLGYAAAMATMSIIATVRGWIAAATAAQWGLNAAMAFMTGATGIGLIVAGIVALVAGLVWFFTQTELGKDIVKNVWGFIQSTVSGVVDWFTSTALPVIQEVFRKVGAVFTWLYETIIKPVFDGISVGVNAMWLVVRGIFQLISSVITNILGPAFAWLYENKIKPVFDGIAGVVEWVWKNVLKPTFDAWVGLFRNVLGPAVAWLYETIIKPKFDAIGSAIKWVWDYVIRPVFNALSDHVTKTIPKAFEDGVGFIKSIWNGLQEIAKAPIRFIIGTVLNDGLIGAFNNVAGFLPGVNKLPRVALPPGFANGGYTGDGGKHELAGNVHKGEYVFTKEQTAAIGKDKLAAMAGGAHHAGSPMRGSEPFIQGPTQDAIRATRRLNLFTLGNFPLSDAQTAARAWNGRAGVSVGAQKYNSDAWGPNAVSVVYGMMPPNAIGYYQGQSIAMSQNNSMQRETLIHEVGHALGIHHNTGNTSVMHPQLAGGGAVWPTAYDSANLRTLYGMPGSGSPGPVADDGGKSGGGGIFDNPITGIIDMLMKKFKDAFPAGGALIDLVGAVGKKILTSAADFITGKSDGGGGAGQGKAATATLYDGGGWLENTGGAQLVQHNKRKPDAVLSSAQWATMSRIADNSAAGNTFEGNLYLDSGEFLGKVRGAARQEIAMADSQSQFTRIGRR